LISLPSNTSRMIVWQKERWESGSIGREHLNFLPFYFTSDYCHRLHRAENQRWRPHPLNKLVTKSTIQYSHCWLLCLMRKRVAEQWSVRPQQHNLSMRLGTHHRGTIATKWAENNKLTINRGGRGSSLTRCVYALILVCYWGLYLLYYCFRRWLNALITQIYTLFFRKNSITWQVFGRFAKKVAQNVA
jgi:hypothetical protein